MFFEMFKELDHLKYSNSSVYKVLGRYPACDKLDL